MEFVNTPGAPQAIGPYAQAVAEGEWLFCSGQIALDPKSGELSGKDAAAQARRALANLAAVLAAGGASLATVVKTTVFLADLADFQAVNAVYAEAFGTHRPARSTVQAAGLPRGALVEIEAIARRKE
ncbi:MAG: Rid family detoxifying hydrolase [Planctomycetaceae bacterium]